MELTQERVRELFDYDDGRLIWKQSRKRIQAGAIAGSKMKHGYFEVCISQKSHYVHRIVFLWHYGHMPQQIDHIDGNPSNNKIGNLRAATQSQNNCNKRWHAKNTSGYKGVSMRRDIGRWQAVINVMKKRIHLGYFDDREAAADAYADAVTKYHGEFSRI